MPLVMKSRIEGRLDADRIDERPFPVTFAAERSGLIEHSCLSMYDGRAVIPVERLLVSRITQRS